MPSLENLFRPITIGALEIKNRIVMPPMVTGFAGLDWGVTDRLIEYHVARARGGVGLIIVESTSVDPIGVGPSAHLGIFQERGIAGLNQLAEAVKAYGVKIGLQLGHTGRQAKWVGEGANPVAPSSIPCRFVGSSLKAKVPKELSSEEIHDLAEKFAEGASRAQRAGFDLIEIHGAHGYLVNEFMSAYTNKRTDEYGGGIEGRMRFPLEIVQAIRKRVGPIFPLSFRLNADDYIAGGLTLDETRIMAKMLGNEGISVIHVTASIYESILYHSPKMWQVPPMCIPRGCFSHLGAGIKNAVNIPVIVVGRINNPALADEIIRDGKADLVSMGRALLADPELPIKSIEGRSEEIRVCIACNKCVSRLYESLSIKCTVNAELGREREYQIVKAPLSRKIVVVGGGPAGMELARVAAARGHKVSLYEKENALGGQLLLAAKPPFKQEIQGFTEYLANQLQNSGVQLFLGTRVDADMAECLRPDVLILATGSTALIPSIPGVESNHLYTALEILKGNLPLPDEKEVIIAGGGMVGCETAEFLWEKSRGLKKITVIEMLPQLATEMDVIDREFLIQRLRDKGIEALVSMKIVEICPEGIMATDLQGERHLIKGQTIILAMGAASNADLAKSLEKKGVKFYAIGDCVKPGRIYEAIQEAAHLGRQI